MVKINKRWNETKLLKVIKKEIRKRNNLRIKFDKQKLVVSALLEEYRKRYLY